MGLLKNTVFLNPAQDPLQLLVRSEIVTRTILVVLYYHNT